MIKIKDYCPFKDCKRDHCFKCEKMQTDEFKAAHNAFFHPKPNKQTFKHQLYKNISADTLAKELKNDRRPVVVSGDDYMTPCALGLVI